MPVSPRSEPTLSAGSRAPETDPIHVDTSDFEPLPGAKGAKGATLAGPIPDSTDHSEDWQDDRFQRTQEWSDELRSDEARLER